MNVMTTHFSPARVDDRFKVEHAFGLSISLHLLFIFALTFYLHAQPNFKERKFREIRVEILKKPTVPVKPPPEKPKEQKPLAIKTSPISPQPRPILASQPIQAVAVAPKPDTFVSSAPTRLVATSLAGQTPTIKAVESRTAGALPNPNFGEVVRTAGLVQSAPSTYSLPPGQIAPRTMAAFAPEEEALSEKERGRILEAYVSSIREKIARAKTYPPEARRQGSQGKTLVTFILGRDGQVVNLNIVEPSGQGILDNAAMQAVKDASPYPPIPANLNQDSLSLKLPISFVLR
jgi:protein TonB